MWPPYYPWPYPPTGQYSWTPYQHWNSPNTPQYLDRNCNSNGQVRRYSYGPYQYQNRYSPYQSSQLAMAGYRHSFQHRQYQYSGDSLVGGRGSYRFRTGRGTDKSEQDSQGLSNAKERKRKEAEENEDKKTKEVSEVAAAKTAIDKKESASARFDQMRAWTAAAGGETETGLEGSKVRVMSYNILAQDYVGSYSELYRLCDQAALDWGVRFEGIKREVIMYEPDIVCMQEVQFSSGTDNSTHFKSDLEPFFSSHGYSNQVKQKTGAKVDGCVIFYKVDKFKLALVRPVEFKSDTISALSSDTVGLICKLIPLAVPTTPLVVATTHLLYTVNKEHTRVCQAALFLAELDQIAQTPGGGYHATILTGDFNSCAGHPTLQLLLKGHLDYGGHTRLRRVPGHQLYQELGLGPACRFRQTEDLDQTTGTFHHNFGFKSVYPPGPGVSTFQQGWKLVDHVMYSSTNKLKLLSMLSLPTKRNMRKLPKIPSHISPSDHLPLLADFGLPEGFK